MDTAISGSFSHLVEDTLTNGKFGVCNGISKITDINTGCVTVQKGPCGDRFKLNIPYAGVTLTWEVLLDNIHPEEPPDFIFGPDDTNFVPDIQDIQSLANWDPRNPQALTEVVEELLRHYRFYQERLVEANSRIKFQYTSLFDAHEEDGIKLEKENVEIYTNKTETKMGPINFLIKLPVDFSCIPAYITKDNPGKDTAVLLLSFPTAESTRVTPQLYLSPRVEHALGGSSNLRIPAFPSGGCVMDYIPGVCQLLQNKVDQIIQNFEKRREYMAAFLSHYGRSVLEFDADTFAKLTLLFEWNDFFFIFFIDVPQYFPKDQPIFTFQSIYHESRGKPFTVVDDSYPYSPRWSGNEMAERARSYILDNIRDFQIQSVRSGSL